MKKIQVIHDGPVTAALVYSTLIKQQVQRAWTKTKVVIYWKKRKHKKAA